MFRYSRRSTRRLNSSDQRLQTLFNEVIKHIDCSILEGARSAERQEQLLAEGKSQVAVSKHQSGRAVDVAPYPIDWNDSKRFYYFAGIVIGIASKMGIPIRWGGDWNRNHRFNDQEFNDLVHFELHEEE